MIQLVVAVSNFSVQYNFQSISIALIVMSTLVCTLSDDECKDGNQDGWVTSTATAINGIMIEGSITVIDLCLTLIIIYYIKDGIFR